MKSQINKVLEIDEKTQKLVKDTEKKIEKVREEFRKRATDMENFALEDAKKTAQEEFDKIIEEAKSIATKKEDDDKEKLKEIDELYNKNEKKLIDRAFNKFILGEDDWSG